MVNNPDETSTFRPVADTPANDHAMRLAPPNPPEDRRHLRAANMLRRGRGRTFVARGKGVYRCHNSTRKKTYDLRLAPEPTCQCQDMSRRRRGHKGDPRDLAWCYHLLSLRLWLEREKGGREAERVPPKPYVTRLDARAHDRSLRTEGRRVRLLLKHLVDTIDVEPPLHRGRAGIPLKDLVYMAGLFGYYGASQRWVEDAIYVAHLEGHLSRQWTFSTVSKFLNREKVDAGFVGGIQMGEVSTEELLDVAVRLSAFPLRDVEREFGIDSTHFARPELGVPNLEKPNVDPDHPTLKAHVLCGLNTHAIVGLAVTDDAGDGTGDTTHLQPLVRQAVQVDGWRPESVRGDAAYGNRANVDALKELGVRAIFALRSDVNSVGGQAWRDLYRLYHDRHDEFRALYHKRSNQESLHSAWKRRFGAALRCRNPLAQRNEVRCRALAYNLTVLNYYQHATGLDADWLPDAPDRDPGDEDGSTPAPLLVAR